MLTTFLGFARLLMPGLYLLLELPNRVKHDMDMDITTSVMSIRMCCNNSLMSRCKYTYPLFPERYCPVHRNIILRCKADDVVMSLDILR